MPLIKWNGQCYKSVDALKKAARSIYPDYIYLSHMPSGFIMTALDGERIVFTKTVDEKGNTIVHDRHEKKPVPLDDGA